MRKKEEQALFEKLREAEERIAILERQVSAVAARTEEVAIEKPKLVDPEIEKGTLHGHLPDNLPFEPDS